MIEILFLITGIVFAVLAYDAYTRRMYGVTFLAALYAVYALGYFLVSVSTLP